MLAALFLGLKHYGWNRINVSVFLHPREKSPLHVASQLIWKRWLSIAAPLRKGTFLKLQTRWRSTPVETNGHQGAEVLLPEFSALPSTAVADKRLSDIARIASLAHIFSRTEVSLQVGEAIYIPHIHIYKSCCLKVDVFDKFIYLFLWNLPLLRSKKDLKSEIKWN